MVAFEGFTCYEFAPVGDEPARGWLRADVSIECGTPEHDSVKVLSWAAVVIYPIGFWFAVVMLLCNASTAIASHKPTSFSRCISFLFIEYKITTYWWELMEMVRKFILIGLMVVVCRGSILQIAIGTVVNAAYLVSARRPSACWIDLHCAIATERHADPRTLADDASAGATI
jgi:hypothetical protein